MQSITALGLALPARPDDLSHARSTHYCCRATARNCAVSAAFFTRLARRAAACTACLAAASPTEFRLSNNFSHAPTTVLPRLIELFRAPPFPYLTALLCQKLGGSKVICHAEPPCPCGCSPTRTVLLLIRAACPHAPPCFCCKRSSRVATTRAVPYPPPHPCFNLLVLNMWQQSSLHAGRPYPPARLYSARVQGCPAPNHQRGEPAECFPLRSLLRRRHPCHGHGTFVKQHTFLILNPAYAFGFHLVSSAVPCVTLSCEVTIRAVVRRPGRPVDSPAPQFPKQTGAAPGASGSPRRPLNRHRGALQPKPSAKNRRIRVTMSQLSFSLGKKNEKTCGRLKLSSRCRFNNCT